MNTWDFSYTAELGEQTQSSGKVELDKPFPAGTCLKLEIAHVLDAEDNDFGRPLDKDPKVRVNAGDYDTDLLSFTFYAHAVGGPYDGWSLRVTWLLPAKEQDAPMDTAARKKCDAAARKMRDFIIYDAGLFGAPDTPENRVKSKAAFGMQSMIDLEGRKAVCEIGLFKGKNFLAGVLKPTDDRVTQVEAHGVYMPAGADAPRIMQEQPQGAVTNLEMQRVVSVAQNVLGATLPDPDDNDDHIPF